jgi:hypothetical protein
MTRKTRGEREWERRQKEAEFYASVGRGPIAFTRPGAPVEQTPPEPEQPPQAKTHPPSAQRTVPRNPPGK